MVLEPLNLIHRQFVYFLSLMKDLQILYGGNKKGDWDVGVAIDAVRLSNKLDVVVLVTGDGDFVPLINYLKNLGVYVEVIAFSESTSSSIKTLADDFIDLSADKKKYLIANRRRFIGR